MDDKQHGTEVILMMHLHPTTHPSLNSAAVSLPRDKFRIFLPDKGAVGLGRQAILPGHPVRRGLDLGRNVPRQPCSFLTTSST